MKNLRNIFVTICLLCIVFCVSNFTVSASVTDDATDFYYTYYVGTGTVINVTTSVNIRSGASTSYSIATTYAKGKTFSIIGKAKDSSDYIWYQTADGWIREDFVSVTIIDYVDIETISNQYYWGTCSGATVTTTSWANNGFYIKLTSSNTGQSVRVYLSNSSLLVDTETVNSYVYNLYRVSMTQLYSAVTSAGYTPSTFFASTVSIVMDGYVSINSSGTIQYGPYDLGTSSSYSTLTSKMQSIGFASGSYTGVAQYYNISFTMTTTTASAVLGSSSYTVTYNANGGTSGSVTSQTKYKDVTMTISSSATPTRTGYTFSGWGTYSTDTSANYYSGSSYTSNSTTTLYAIWTPYTYTVTYNANSGTSGSVTSQTKTYGVSMTISSSATPTRTGYTFSGWGTYSTDTSANYYSGSSYTSNSSTTLYAIWTPYTYTVTYNANSGTSGSITSQTKTYDVSMTISSSATPTRTGYTFSGWGTYSTDTSANYYSGSSYTSNSSITLYAIWTPITYTVTYNANGGTSGSITSQTKTYDVSMTISSSATPTRTGYTFSGWGTYSTDTSANYYSGSSYTSNSSTTLYAIWTINTDIYPELIAPNADYYAGNDIIVSYNIYNDGIIDLITSDNGSVTFAAKSISNDGTTSTILTQNKDIVIPADESNLVYFKISLPNDSDSVIFTIDIDSTLVEAETTNNTYTYTFDVTDEPNSQTPDTEFENTPVGFTVPSEYMTVPNMGNTVTSTATWEIWTYENGTFILNEYGVEINPEITVSADSVVTSATVENGITTMKSGYGIEIEISTSLDSVGSLLYPSSDAYTLAQNANVYLPEFSYSSITDEYRTLELVGSVLKFEENENTISNDGTQDYRRVHFTPIWYPDGEYIIKTYTYNLWTPVGMISSTDTINTIIIDGDVYDDWYIN